MYENTLDVKNCVVNYSNNLGRDDLHIAVYEQIKKETFFLPIYEAIINRQRKYCIYET